MKLIHYTIVGTLLLAGNLAYADRDEEKVDKYAVTHMISVDDAVGSAVWDHQGNQIGSISKILLKPLHSETLFAIIDVNWLDEDRKIAVPWSKVYVRTKEDDAEKIIYTLDVTKDYVRAAPVFEDGVDFTDTHMMEVRRYWKVETERHEKDGHLKIKETLETRETTTPATDLPDPE